MDTWTKAALFLLALLFYVEHTIVVVVAAENVPPLRQSLFRDPSIPTPYPEVFTVQFVTNVTSTDWSVPVDNWLYYDWSRRAQRIEHGAGSYECVRFYNVSTGCSLIFLPEGMYRILQDDDLSPSDCCLDLPNVGAPPPDWASQAPYTWKGLKVDDYSGMLAYEWWFDKGIDTTWQQHPWRDSLGETRIDGESDTLPFHTMRQVATGLYKEFPLVFTFPGWAEGRQDMHFLPHTMIHAVPPGRFLFDVPEKCRHRRCSKDGKKISSHAAAQSRTNEKARVN
jgi:hypothetical protein